MLVRTTTVMLLALLAACTPESQDAVARESAKSVVNPILAERFPGLPVSLATDCVIDNATTQEIVTLGLGRADRGDAADDPDDEHHPGPARHNRVRDQRGAGCPAERGAVR